MYKESNHVLIDTTNVFHKQYSNICPVLTTVCVEIHTHIHVHTQKHIYAQYTELVIHKWANHNSNPGGRTDMQSRQSCSLFRSCSEEFWNYSQPLKSQLACYPMPIPIKPHPLQHSQEWALSFLGSIEPGVRQLWVQIAPSHSSCGNSDELPSIIKPWHPFL